MTEIHALASVATLAGVGLQQGWGSRTGGVKLTRKQVFDGVFGKVLLGLGCKGLCDG